VPWLSTWQHLQQIFPFEVPVATTKWQGKPISRQPLSAMHKSMCILMQAGSEGLVLIAAGTDASLFSPETPFVIVCRSSFGHQNGAGVLLQGATVLLVLLASVAAQDMCGCMATWVSSPGSV
jgi:hypothetical protein